MKIIDTKKLFVFAAVAGVLAAAPAANAFRIALTVGSKTTTFTNMSGLDSENEVVEHRVTTSTTSTSVRRVPGRLKLTPVLLTAPLTTDSEPFKWRQMVVNGKVDLARADCTLAVVDDVGKVVTSFKLLGCWPSRISHQMNARGEVERSISVTHDGIDIGREARATR